MALSEVLDEYNKTVTAWLEQTKKEMKAVQALQKAVGTGNLRDLEKLRQTARSAADTASQKADDCAPLVFDAKTYLSSEGEFLGELKAAAERAGVRLHERDGTVFCYPVLVRSEPDLAAVRIDKKLEPGIRPETLAALLKQAQNREPKARPERFIETLLEAYQFAQAKAGISTHIDVPLTDIYDLLTLLPGANKEYTLLDFTRDIYFLDISGITETRKGYRMSLPASTVTRERRMKLLPFVTRDGHEKLYATIKFTPGQGGG